MARSRSNPEGAALSRRVLVLVDRDMTAKTPRVIWQHEKPLLELLFGDGKVVDADPAILDESYAEKISPALLPFNKTQEQPIRPSQAAGLGFVFVGDPAAEFARLSEVYGRMPDENVLVAEKMYGRFSEGRFEALIGEPKFTDLPEAQLRSLLESYGLAPAAPLPTMTDADKTAANEARRAFLTASKADLIRMCEDGGITLG